MFPPDFVEAANTTVYWAGIGLANAQMDYGPTDFPANHGEAFRNDLYAYAHCLFQAVFHYLREEEKTDPWTINNRDRVLKLNADHLFRIAASCQLYARARQIYFANARQHITYLRLSLDWIANAYRVPPEIPKRWFQIVTQAKDLDSWVNDAQAFMYQDIACAIHSDKNDKHDTGAWCGLAIAGDFLRVQMTPEELSKLCSEDFVRYREVVIELRKKALERK